MKKKIFAFAATFILLMGMSNVAFAASEIYVKHGGGFGSYTVYSGESISLTATLDVGPGAGGCLITFPLISIGDMSIWKWLNVPATATVTVDSCIASNGLPVPYWIRSDGVLVVAVPEDSYGQITVSVTCFNGNSVEATVSGNDLCTGTIVGVYEDLSLHQFLQVFQAAGEKLTYDTSQILWYIQLLKSNSDVNNSYLLSVIDKLEWIVAEMEGVADSEQMGDYAGYNYSQLLVEVIRSIQNISFGDIGDVTVQTDLTEVLTLLTNIFNSLDNLEDIEDKTAYLSEQLTLLITYLQDNTETLQSIGLDVQALLDLLASEEFLGYIEDRLDEMVEEQKLTNKTLQDILAALEDIRRSLIYGGGSGGGGSGSATGNLFFEVLDGVLSGVFELLSNLLGIVFKAVFGLFKWVTQFVGWINTDYLGGFFPAPIWAVVSVIIPLIVVLGLIRFVRGFL